VERQLVERHLVERQLVERHLVERHQKVKKLNFLGMYVGTVGKEL
jgi:hypothetical protein